jgi:integrase
VLLLANGRVQRKKFHFLDDLLLFAETSRHPSRNKVIVLLSAKAGLRAGEIAHLTWAMVTDPSGAIGTALELPDAAAKKGSGRVIPLHEDLRINPGGVASSDPFGCPSDRVGAGRANDRAEHRRLVRERVPSDRP